MRILARLAWRNLWRQRRRSLLTASAMALGVAFCLATLSFMDGMLDDTFRLLVREQTGHVEIHHRDYPKQRALYDTIPHPELLLPRLRALPHLAALSERLYGYALLGVGDEAAGARLRGVLPEHEARAVHIDRKILAGRYLSPEPAHEILLGQGLARSLHAEVGDEVVAVTQAADGSLGNELYTVVGIFRSGSVEMDRAGALLHLEDARELFVLPGGLHELVLQAPSDDEAEALAEEAREVAGGGLLVRSWKEIDPQAAQLLRIQGAITGIVLFMLYSVAALGVLNTLLMSVFEQFREFGVMRALGLRPRQLVAVVLLESLFLALLGGAVGLVLGLAAQAYLATHGLDLRPFMSSESWSWMGVSMEPVMRGSTRPGGIAATLLGLVGVALLSALWPALVAARLDPVEAMRRD